MDKTRDKLMELKPIVDILKIGIKLVEGFWLWYLSNGVSKANSLADELEKNGFEVKR